MVCVQAAPRQIRRRGQTRHHWPGRRTPTASGAVHVFHQYTIRVVDQDRDKFAEELVKRGVGCGVYYPTPIHRLPSFGLTIDLPVTEQVALQCLSLPVHPSLSKKDLETIVETVNAVAKAGA